MIYYKLSQKKYDQLMDSMTYYWTNTNYITFLGISELIQREAHSLVRG